MYQDWDLIEVDMARARAEEEARKRAVELEAAPASREQDDQPSSPMAESTMSPTWSKRHKKDMQVLGDSTNVPRDNS